MPFHRSPKLSAEQTLRLGELTIRSRRDGDTHVLELCGELDVAGAARAEAELQLAERSAVALIIVDLHELKFIDSGGMRLLIQAARRAEPGRLRLLRPADRVFEVFVISGLATRLPFAEAPPRVTQSARAPRSQAPPRDPSRRRSRQRRGLAAKQSRLGATRHASDSDG